MIYLATDKTRFRIGVSNDIPQLLFKMSQFEKWSLVAALDLDHSEFEAIENRFAQFRVPGINHNSHHHIQAPEMRMFFLTHPARCDRVRMSDQVRLRASIGSRYAGWLEASAKMRGLSVDKEIERLIAEAAGLVKHEA